MRKSELVPVLAFSLGLMYPLNELFLQPFEIGPLWSRWLLSDLSFPIAMAIVLYYVFKLPTRYGVSIGGFTALSVEYGQMVHILQGKGHIEDIIIIVIGSIIGLIVSRKYV